MFAIHITMKGACIMPLFVCDECGCVDNTATGFYWTYLCDKHAFKDESKNGKALCCECAPQEYSDGSICERHGKWHGYFPKQTWEKAGYPEVMNRDKDDSI